MLTVGAQMSKHRENIDVVAHEAPRLPKLEDVPRVMQILRHERTSAEDAAFLVEAIGAAPHIRVRGRWLRALIGTPRDRFPGGPLWYRHVGHAPARVGKYVSDEQGLPIGRRLVDPGEVVQAQTWKYEGHGDWERIDDPRPVPQPKIRKGGKRAQHRP